MRKADAPLDLLDGLVENVEGHHEGELEANNSATLPVPTTFNGTDVVLESDVQATHLSPNQASPMRGGELRRRAPGSTTDLETGIHQYGRLQLTLRYSSHRLCLVVVVHKAW